MPTPNIYVKVLLAFALCLACFIGGYYVEHLKFKEYQEKVIADGKVQEQHNKDLEKQRKLENDKKDADFAAQLAAIKRLYNASSSSMPKPSATLVSVNGYTTDPVFAELCANSTAQLISLQQWVNDQISLK